MSGTRRRYTVVVSIVVSDEDFFGQVKPVGYALTGGANGLDDETDRQRALHGPQTIVAASRHMREGLSDAGFWASMLPEEFGEITLADPDPVVLGEHDTVLAALEQIQAMVEAVQTDEVEVEVIPLPHPRHDSGNIAPDEAGDQKPPADAGSAGQTG